MGELAASVLPGAAVVGGGTQYTKELFPATVFMAKRRSHLGPLQSAEGRGLVAVQQWWEQGVLHFWHSWSLLRLHVTGSTGQLCDGCLVEQPLGHHGTHCLACILTGTAAQEVSAGSCMGRPNSSCGEHLQGGRGQQAGLSQRLACCCPGPRVLLMLFLVCFAPTGHTSFHRMHSNVTCRQQLPGLTE